MPKRKERGICPYCNREKNLEKEHVIPQTLFRVLDPEMVVVKICAQCNQGMSPHIRDLRNLIALSLESGNHPDAEFHIKKILETNEATRTWLKKTIDNAEEIDFVTEQGITLGQGISIEFDKERARQALAQIVRGLYFITMDTPLPYGTPVSVIEIPTLGARRFVQNITKYDHGEMQSRGTNVATWIPYVNIPEQGPETSAWLLIFWNAVCFFGGTGNYAAPIEQIWQQWLQNESEPRRINGRIQILAPRQPDGGYYIPPQ